MSTSLQALKNPENIKFVAPIAGAMFAILVDIGFFASLGSSWFTFFSLSEHIQLALSAAPAAAVLVGLFYGSVFIAVFVHKRVDRLRRSEHAVFHVGRRPFALRHLWWGVISVLLVTEVAFALHMIFNGQVDELVEIILFMLAGGTVTTFVIYMPLANEGLLIVGALFICAVTAFSFGFWYGYSVQTLGDAPYTLHLKDGKLLAGVALVAGERGVLFFDTKDHKTQYWLWRQIDLLDRDARFLSAGSRVSK